MVMLKVLLNLLNDAVEAVEDWPTLANLQLVLSVHRQFVRPLNATMNGYHTFVPNAPAGQSTTAGTVKFWLLTLYEVVFVVESRSIAARTHCICDPTG